MSLEKKFTDFKKNLKRVAIGTLAGLTLLTTTKPINAASIGGAKTIGKGKFSIGFEQEFVSDRNIEYKGEKPTQRKTEIERMRRSTLVINYGLHDNLEGYIKLGAAHTKIMADGEFEWGAVGGIGIKATKELAKNWLIGTNIQYLAHNKPKLQEWEIAPYIGKRFGKFTPYTGMKYSDLRVKNGGLRWKADSNLGLFLGTTYKINSRLSLNFEIEGIFFQKDQISDGASVTSKLSYRF